MSVTLPPVTPPSIPFDGTALASAVLDAAAAGAKAEKEAKEKGEYKPPRPAEAHINWPVVSALAPMSLATKAFTTNVGDFRAQANELKQHPREVAQRLIGTGNPILARSQEIGERASLLLASIAATRDALESHGRATVGADLDPATFAGVCYALEYITARVANVGEQMAEAAKVGDDLRSFVDGKDTPAS